MSMCSAAPLVVSNCDWILFTRLISINDQWLERASFIPDDGFSCILLEYAISVCKSLFLVP